RRRRFGRQHDVEQLLEIVHILPSGRRVRLCLVDGGDVGALGGPIQRDKSAPRINIEAALQVCQPDILLSSRTYDFLTRWVRQKNGVPDLAVNRKQSLGETRASQLALERVGYGFTTARVG